MKFSIIIPLYNKAPYVRKALETVCAQTYHDYEIIVINDGSTDNSAIVAEEYLGSIGGVHYMIINQQNAGVSAARNNGVAQAQGEYIAFLDADDWWEPTYLERMAQLIEDYPEAGLYGMNYIYYKPGKTRVALKCKTGYINYPKEYYEGSAMMIFTTSSSMPKRVFEEMGGFPLGIKLGEDFLLWAKIAMHYPVAFCEEPLAYYNNDVPTTLRATRNLHAPEHHMLFRLELLGDKAMRRLGDEGKVDSVKCKGEENGKADTPASTPYTLHLTPSKADWKQLIDKLRVGGLLEYWMSEEYHDQAAEELKKVDWSQQPKSVIRIYKTPIWMLKAKRQVMKWGSWCKQLIIRLKVIG